MSPSALSVNPLLGYGSIQASSYTASPLRAFESELAETKMHGICTRYALAGAPAPGTASSGCGGVSTKAVNSCVHATVILIFLAFMLSTFTAVTA